jgi:hypothetical protein
MISLDTINQITVNKPIVPNYNLRAGPLMWGRSQMDSKIGMIFDKAYIRNG